MGREIVECGHCGVRSRLEGRLHAGVEGPPATYMEPPHRFDFLRRLRLRRDEARDALVEDILHESTVDQRVELISRLDPWEALTAEREASLTDLLRLARENPLVEKALAGLVSRFLQRGDQESVGFAVHPWRYFVLRCATRVLFEPAASGLLVQELKWVRGGGAAIKLLLDLAEHGLRSGEEDLALDALDALDTTLVSSFNWDQYELMSDIVVYRMPYLDERVLALVIHALSPLWAAFLKPRVVSRLVDDCVRERPDLVPVLCAGFQPAMYGGPEDYIEYLDFVATLFSPVARTVAFMARPYGPYDGSPPTAEQATQILDRLERLREAAEGREAPTAALRAVAADLVRHETGSVRTRAREILAALPDVGEPSSWPESPYRRRLEEIAEDLRTGREPRSRAWTPGPCPRGVPRSRWSRILRREDDQESDRMRLRYRQETRRYKRSWLSRNPWLRR
jgi:hypothetical protein